MGLLPGISVSRDQIRMRSSLYFPFRFCSRKRTCFRTGKSQHSPSWTLGGSSKQGGSASAAERRTMGERGGRGRRTDRVVLEQAHGLRGPRPAEGVVEARHGLREQPDDYDARFSWPAMSACRAQRLTEGHPRLEEGTGEGGAYLSSPLWRHGRFARVVARRDAGRCDGRFWVVRVSVGNSLPEPVTESAGTPRVCYPRFIRRATFGTGEISEMVIFYSLQDL